MVANMEKSRIFMACVDELIKDQLLALSGFNQVDKKCREYLWGSTEEKRKIALVAWDKEMMKGWYTQGRYQLTHNNQYSITGSYNAMLGQQSRLNIAELIWTAL
ncbi:hypothetical protein H5410_055717 [Solanum commersonii]|uniref:Uncharacterized protein n=1 Tax=Solanum commersonii TaxID=4109 RepID=A0A9J5WJY2_SOLCO|nr:hypothetical protein H5410_055717 [Solanum commersonii]